jgi:hypothetical protein
LLAAVGALAALVVLVIAVRPTPKPAHGSLLAVTTSGKESASASIERTEPSAPAQAGAVPAPSASAPTSSETTASEAPPAEDETVKIAINIKPDGSLFTYKGKTIGRTPFILKQPRNEKRVYEVGKVGHATRRITINGTEKNIGFELPQEVPHPDSL